MKIFSFSLSTCEKIFITGWANVCTPTQFIIETLNVGEGRIRTYSIRIPIFRNSLCVKRRVKKSGALSLSYFPIQARSIFYGSSLRNSLCPHLCLKLNKIPFFMNESLTLPVSGNFYLTASMIFKRIPCTFGSLYRSISFKSATLALKAPISGFSSTNMPFSFNSLRRSAFFERLSLR